MPQPTDKATTDTIAQIISRLRQPAALQAAMQRWRALQREYAEKSNALRAAVAELDQSGGENAPDAGPMSRRITGIDAELRELANRAQGALEDIAEARPPFVAAALTALAPVRRAAAQRALAASDLLVRELDIIAKVDDGIIAASGSPGLRALPRYTVMIAPIVERLRRIAGVDETLVRAAPGARETRRPVSAADPVEPGPAP